MSAAKDLVTLGQSEADDGPEHELVGNLGIKFTRHLELMAPVLPEYRIPQQAEKLMRVRLPAVAFGK
jgi:hypothetical protein